jgi:hypothetical protein
MSVEGIGCLRKVKRLGRNVPTIPLGGLPIIVPEGDHFRWLARREPGDFRQWQDLARWLRTGKHIPMMDMQPVVNNRPEQSAIGMINPCP